MTSPFASGGGKEQQTFALAFAVASLQSSGETMDGVQIPQTLLDASTAAANKYGSSSNDLDYAESISKGCSEEASTARSSDAESNDEDDEEEKNEHGGEDDSKRRLARSRERNREHARRTRLRKKAQLEALQSKVKGLEAERQLLKQKVEECGIASILLGLSSGEQDQLTQNLLESASDPTATESPAKSAEQQRSDMVAVLSGAKRKRFISEAIGEQPNQQQHHLTINVDGNVTVIGAGKSHINWKTGVYRDEKGIQRQLAPDQLEDLRRERNRMHAKKTRSRKKCFVATIEKAIAELEAENYRMRDVLEKVSASTALTQMVTPASSPELSPKHVFFHETDDHLYQEKVTFGNKRFKSDLARPSHGFRLDD